MTNNEKHYVVGLGEALWDVLPEGKKLGGAPANFAFHAGQFGLDSIAVSAVGEDDLGEETLKEFGNKQLNYLMPRVPYPTGTVQVTVDAQGVPSYDIKEGVAWDNIPFTKDIEEVARHCQAVCWGSLAQRNAASRATINKFLDNMPDDGHQLRIFDINLRQHFYSTDVIEDSLRRCNVLKINDEELDTVSHLFGFDDREVEAQCRYLLNKYNLDILVLTCGVDGSYVFTPDKKSFLPTPKVQVADTVGAGDSFTGSFCAAILQGMPVEKAHQLAVSVSAYVCTQQGAMPQLPEALKRLS